MKSVSAFSYRRRRFNNNANVSYAASTGRPVILGCGNTKGRGIAAGAREAKK